MERIGFVGLGTMGAPMAGHLLDAGYPVTTVVHRARPGSELLRKGLTILSELDELAAESDVVILMVPDTPDVERVLWSERGVATGLREGSLVIDMSSISPAATAVFAERVRDLGSGYLDAPVSGGEVGAKGGDLTIMVGGSEEDFERARPLFELMGGRVTLIGENGAGQTCKVANQIVVAGAIQSVAEALVFAAASGVDQNRVHQALMGGLASSRVLELHGPRMIDAAFEPGFRIELHMKDLSLAMADGREASIALPLTALLQQLMVAAVAQGDAALDHAGMIRVVQRLSGQLEG